MSVYQKQELTYIFFNYHFLSSAITTPFLMLTYSHESVYFTSSSCEKTREVYLFDVIQLIPPNSTYLNLVQIPPTS